MCRMTQIELIGTPECARLLGLTRAHVNRLAATNDLPAVGKIGKRGINVFDRDAIEALAAERGGENE